jgi:hypothetical protein
VLAVVIYYSIAWVITLFAVFTLSPWLMFHALLFATIAGILDARHQAGTRRWRMPRWMIRDDYPGHWIE